MSARDAEAPRGASRQRRSRITTTTLILGWTAVAVLHVVYLRGYRLDTDEPQHLHVVWSWVRGLVQYRDVFDNHAPLFHVLFAPIAAAIGERADILFAMRLTMLPLTAAALWSTYAIGRATFGRTVATWASLFTALVPAFFLASVEFRADALWAVLWLAAIAVLFGGPATPRRAFVVGLLLGAAVCTSLKTLLLLVAFGSALAVTIARDRRPTRAMPGPAVLAAAAGLAIVPAMTVLFFAWYGAVGAMLRATVTHNVLGGLAVEHQWTTTRILGLAIAPPFWWWAGECAARSTSNVRVRARRRIVVLTVLTYALLVEDCWPIATRQDLEPWLPLAMLVVTGAGFDVVKALAARAPRYLDARTATPLLGGGIALAQVALLICVAEPWQLPHRVDPGLLGDVLRLTRASDTIMDLKGETVFRDRPFFWVLEALTRERMRVGQIADTIPEDLVARRTCVAVLDTSRLPPRGREFLRDNYVPVGRLRVAGRVLAPAAPSRRTITFDVSVPAPYTVVADGRSVAGWLDGRRAGDAVLLGAGRHRLRIAPTAAPVTLVWAPAVERGFVPFAPGGQTLAAHS